jgi:hypothetical protein
LRGRWALKRVQLTRIHQARFAESTPSKHIDDSGSDEKVDDDEDGDDDKTYL